MNFLETYYGSRDNLRRELVTTLFYHRRRKRLKTADVEKRCSLPPGLLGEIEADNSKLTSDVFLDVCNALDLTIESAMTIDPTPQQISDACRMMKQRDHGVRAASGGGDYRAADDLAEREETFNGITYEDQAQLYIRLQILDEFDGADEPDDSGAGQQPER